MGLFSGLVSGVKAILGVGKSGSDNVMTVAKGIGGWIDGQYFTDQERAEMNMKMIGHFSTFMEHTANENSERSRTRREIAIWIIRAEITFLAASGLLYKLDADWSKYLYQIAAESPMGILTLGVGAFFFGTHLLRSAKK